MAKVYGLTALRFADDVVLPFNMIEYADAIQEYVQSIVQVNETVDFSFLVNAANNFSAAAQVCFEIV